MNESRADGMQDFISDFISDMDAIQIFDIAVDNLSMVDLISLVEDLQNYLEVDKAECDLKGKRKF